MSKEMIKTPVFPTGLNCLKIQPLGCSSWSRAHFFRLCTASRRVWAWLPFHTGAFTTRPQTSQTGLSQQNLRRTLNFYFECSGKVVRFLSILGFLFLVDYLCQYRRYCAKFLGYWRLGYVLLFNLVFLAHFWLMGFDLLVLGHLWLNYVLLEKNLCFLAPRGFWLPMII